jgi:hypothetical protein
MPTNSIGFPILNLPEFEYTTRQALKQRTEIFDAFRNKYVVLTPEEWVRQHMLHYMHDELKYPKNLIGVEVSMTRLGKNERADIVVYTPQMEPWLIVECKSADVELKQHVFDQAARYNLVQGVEFLVITNGFRLVAAEINSKLHNISFLKQMPLYPINKH